MTQVQTKTREVHGILLLDKPIGITSNAALQAVKRLFRARKAGHTGSLDPLASGMLPLCLGEATKFSRFLLEADKNYQVTAKLGIQTTTGDADGEIVQQQQPSGITLTKLKQVLAQFHGEIEQLPSMYSAIKYQGQPLYKLARQGKVVERQIRKITIHQLDLQDYHENEAFSFHVSCSKGTYIRTLVEDMGKKLGCGAHVINLRRLSVGPYHEQQMVSLQDLQNTLQDGDQKNAVQNKLLSPDSSVAHWPEVRLSESAAYYICRGQPVIVPHAPTDGWVRLTNPQGQFLGVGEILSDGKVAPRRLVKKV